MKAHDWYDVLFEEHLVLVDTEIQTPLKSMFSSFYTESGEICGEHQLLQTANFIGDVAPTWGINYIGLDYYNLTGEKPWFQLPKYSKQSPKHSQDANRNNLEFPLRDSNHENNRADMLLHFDFPVNISNNATLIFKMYFMARYHQYERQLEMSLFGNITFTKFTSTCFISLNAFYKIIEISSQSLDPTMASIIDMSFNQTLKLSWIPQTKVKEAKSIFSRNKYYVHGWLKSVLLTWKEALVMCKLNNSLLPVITSKSEQSNIVRLVEGYQLPILYIGLYDMQVKLYIFLI